LGSGGAAVGGARGGVLAAAKAAHAITGVEAAG
jgi:hypothetical protein